MQASSTIMAEKDLAATTAARHEGLRLARWHALAYDTMWWPDASAAHAADAMRRSSDTFSRIRSHTDGLKLDEPTA